MVRSVPRYPRAWRVVAHWLFLALAASACRTKHDDIQTAATMPAMWHAADSLGPRRFIDASLDSLWAIMPADSTAAPFHPNAIRVWRNLITIRDDGDRVATYTKAGQFQWALGNPIKGKPRMRRFVDLALDGNRDLALLDEREHAIVHVSPTGETVRTVLLPESDRFDRFAPLPRQRYALITPLEDTSVAIIDSTGTVISHAPMPWAGFAKLEGIARQLTVATDGAGHWAALLTLGNGWFSFDDTAASHVLGRYVNHHDFPSIRVRTFGKRRTTSFAGYSPCTGCDAQVRGDTLWMLAGGSNTTIRKVIDVFDLTTARYLASIHLPEPASAIAISGDTVFAAVARGRGGAVIAYRLRRLQLAAVR